MLNSFGEVRSRRTLDVRAPITGRILELASGFEEVQCTVSLVLIPLICNRS